MKPATDSKHHLGISAQGVGVKNPPGNTKFTGWRMKRWGAKHRNLTLPAAVPRGASTCFSPSWGVGSTWNLVLILTADPSADGRGHFSSFPGDVIHAVKVKLHTLQNVTPRKSLGSRWKQRMESNFQPPLSLDATQGWGRVGKEVGFCRWLLICRLKWAELQSLPEIIFSFSLSIFS